MSGIRDLLVLVRGNNVRRLIGDRILAGVLLGALARPFRARWLADNHQPDFRAATGWCTTRH